MSEDSFAREISELPLVLIGDRLTTIADELAGRGLPGCASCIRAGVTQLLQIAAVRGREAGR